MDVVLLGSAGVDVHAIGRALGRALDATVVDGERLRQRISGPDDPEPPSQGMAPDWLGALRLALPEGRCRPHGVATVTSLSSAEREALRAAKLLLVHLSQCAEGEVQAGVAEVDGVAEAHELVVAVDAGVEVAAARVLGRLVPHLDAVDSGASHSGDTTYDRGPVVDP